MPHHTRTDAPSAVGGQKPHWVDIPPFDSCVAAAEHDRSKLIQITREEITTAWNAVMAEFAAQHGAAYVQRNIAAINAAFPDERLEAILFKVKTEEQAAIVAKHIAAKADAPSAAEHEDADLRRKIAESLFQARLKLMAVRAAKDIVAGGDDYARAVIAALHTQLGEGAA